MVFRTDLFSGQMETRNSLSMDFKSRPDRSTELPTELSKLLRRYQSKSLSATEGFARSLLQ